MPHFCSPAWVPFRGELKISCSSSTWLNPCSCRWQLPICTCHREIFPSSFTLNKMPLKPSEGLMYTQHGKPNSDSGSLQQRKALLQDIKQGSGRQASDLLQLGLSLGFYLFKGKNQKAGINYWLVTLLWCFLIVVLGVTGYLWPGGPCLGVC